MNSSARFQFGLSSLFLITTLVAVVMSVNVMVPGLGIALGVVATPALIRTYILVRHSRKDGRPASMKENVMLFLTCLGIATLIALATGVAFYVTFVLGFFGAFWAGAESSDGSLGWCAVVGLPLGTIAGSSVLIVLIVKWFRWGKRPAANPLLKSLHDIPGKKPSHEESLRIR